MSTSHAGHARLALAACLLAPALCATTPAGAQPVLRRAAVSVPAAAPVGDVRPVGVLPIGVAPASIAPAPRRRRSPLLAGMLSMCIPGLGHVYAGEPWRGLAVFAVTDGALVTAMAAENHTVGSIAGTVGFGGYVFGMLDGAEAANRYNARHEPPRPAVARR